MATELKKFRFEKEDLSIDDGYFILDTYNYSSNICIQVFSETKGPVMTITRYVGDLVLPIEIAAIVDSSCVWSFLIDNDLGVIVGKVTELGRLKYPLFLLNLQKIVLWSRAYD